jgi:hypothetical protein
MLGRGVGRTLVVVAPTPLFAQEGSYYILYIIIKETPPLPVKNDGFSVSIFHIVKRVSQCGFCNEIIGLGYHAGGIFV